jgi:hypothetical protein
LVWIFWLWRPIEMIMKRISPFNKIYRWMKRWIDQTDTSLKLNLVKQCNMKLNENETYWRRDGNILRIVYEMKEILE